MQARTEHRLIAALLVLAGAVMLAASTAANAQMYRWVDEHGVTHYGDRIPPEYARVRREEINESGRVIGVHKRQATAAERAAERQRQARAAAERRATQRRSQYDRSLTATYHDVRQLEHAYDDRLAIVAGKIRSTESIRDDVRGQLDALYKRSEKRGAEAGLDKRIRQTEARLAEKQAIIDRLEQQRTEIRRQFEADRARFLELTADRR